MPLQVIIALADCSVHDKSDQCKYYDHVIPVDDTAAATKRVLERMDAIDSTLSPSENALYMDAKLPGVVYVTFMRVTKQVDASMLMLQAMAACSNSRLVTSG